jgi:LemA protein
MGTPEDIRRLIGEGKVSDEDGARLLEAFETVESRDRLVREELARVRSARRSARLWVALSVGACLLVFGGLIVSVVSHSGSKPVATTQLSEEMRSLIGQDLDGMIATLTDKLRQPGSAADYRLLGMAYEQRYQQSKSASDRQGAAEAFARAERLERRMTMKGNPVIFGMLFVLVVITGIVLWIMAMYNGLARSDERVDERWAQVEAVLQRRLDLIPQLLETVKGYATHERDTLLAVTEARAKALGMLQATSGKAPESSQAIRQLNQAQDALSSALSKLLALAEQYPDVKAGTNFLTLQDQLEGTENRITVERQRYNNAVRTYNSRLRMFPSNVVAGMFGYEPREYFESKVGAEDPVVVKF